MDGCLAYVECRVSEVFSAGDHDIFLGEVLEGEIVESKPPLLFHCGRYRQLASAD